MSSKYDVYSLCGCGSGKNLKFCCVDVVAEVIKAGKLQQQGQYSTALKALDRIEKKNPGLPWTTMIKASIMLEKDDPEAAYHLIEALLNNYPDHKLAMTMRANTALSAWGFDVAKPAIYQAIYVGVDNYHELLSRLIRSVALKLYEEQRYLAARQYYGLAMRLSTVEEQQEAYMTLLRFDSEEKIPYPFRSVYKLAELTVSSDDEETYLRAMQFASMSQWQAATGEFEKLVEVDTENGLRWKNLGFCRAWDGNEIEASEALHKAAELTEDFDEAVELETIAQLIDLHSAQETVSVLQLIYHLNNTDELISALDFHPRFERTQVGNVEETIEYSILDRLSPGFIEDPEFSLEELPCEIGSLTVPRQFAEGNEDGMVGMTATETTFQSCRDFVEEVVSEFVEIPEKKPEMGLSLLKQKYQLMVLQTIPSETPLPVKGILRRRLIENKVYDVWTSLPQIALGNQSPDDVAGTPDSQIKLTAAIYLLDAISGNFLGTVSVKKLLNQFNLPAPIPLSIDNDQPLHLLSNMQIHRLSLPDLSEDQLRHVLDRSRLTNHPSFVYDLIQEAISRPEFAKNDIDLLQAYLTLISICQEEAAFETAIEWVDRATEAISNSEENSFENILQLDIRKVTLLIYLQDESPLKEHLQYLRDKYGRKVPQYLEAIEQSLIDITGKPLPISLTDGLLPVESSSESVWTPGNVHEPKSAEEKKIWLPGS